MSDSRHKPPKEIRCACPACKGRVWPLPQIRALPNFPHGKPINGKTLPDLSNTDAGAYELMPRNERLIAAVADVGGGA